MTEYEVLEHECTQNKMYAKRVMDLYCDGKKWEYMAHHTHNDSDMVKYNDISNTLMQLFYKEIETMK